MNERRKLATLLFCDLSGSTAMGERVQERMAALGVGIASGTLMP